MANRSYCIIERGDNYYIPVKAKYNPYLLDRRIEKVSYLACLPNFFGGKEESDDGGLWVGLAREVEEESQGQIIIAPEVLEGRNRRTLYQCDLPGNNEMEHYEFYLVTVSDEGEYFAGDLCILNRPGEAKTREMSCILKLAVNELAGKDLNGFLNLCRLKAGNLVDLNLRIAQWNRDEGTKDAFAALLGL